MSMAKKLKMLEQEREQWQAELRAVMRRENELLKQARTEQQIQRACGSLPNGWSIQIELENGAGYAVLYNPQGGATDFDTAGEGIAEQISAATDWAITTHKAQQAQPL
tara:strand:- start:1152 stop:1475 length:324 start_codon:yes stop_codon:yes gene_type:complete